MKSYLFKINSFELRIYSLMYIIALLLAIFLAKRDKVAIKRGVKKEYIEDFAYITLVSGIIGARIYYVIFKWEIYLDNIFDIFKIWQGGLAIHGGIIGGFIGILIYSKIKKINLFTLTDMAVGPLLLGQGLGRIGNFFNGEIHGFPVITPFNIIVRGKFNNWWSYFQSLSISSQLEFKELVPWGVKFPLDTPAGYEFPNMKLHPAMLYEMILNLIGFFLIYYVLRKREYNRGILSMAYLIIYGIIRIIVSTFRAEDLLFFGIKVPYIISLVMIILGIVGINFLREKK